MDLKSCVDEVHAIAISKGWWPTLQDGKSIQRSSLEIRMLIVSELAEACEEVRNSRPPLYQWNKTQDEKVLVPAGDARWVEGLKPEGESVELVDTVIRIFDYFGARKWNIDLHMEDSFHLPEHDKSLEVHMEIVKLIACASDEDEEKRLGRAVKVIKEYFERKKWNFEEVLRMKIAYNKTRSVRHGGKIA